MSTPEPVPAVDAEVLLPCPFCGTSASMADMKDRDERRFWFRSISCDGCDATVEESMPWGTFQKLSRAQAANALANGVAQNWNARVALAAETEAADLRVERDALVLSTENIGQSISKNGQDSSESENGAGTGYWISNDIGLDLRVLVAALRQGRMNRLSPFGRVILDQPMTAGLMMLAADRLESLDASLTAITAELAGERVRAAALKERHAALYDELVWYGEQARLARLIHREGDAGRHALANDGGRRARAALESRPTLPDTHKTNEASR